MQSPWLSAFEPAILSACLDLHHVALLDWLGQEAQARGLVSGRGQALHFVPQGALPAGEAYESFIARTGGVPTRDNLHDRLNALVWLHLPAAKARLNQIQDAVIDAHGGVGPARGTARDRATLLDENGLILLDLGDDQSLAEGLLVHDWRRLFLRERSRWQTDWLIFPMGHALLEKLQQPFKAITAHAWVFSGSVLNPDWAWVDARLEMALAEAAGSAGLPRFQPIPVMGLPGWSADQSQPHFYQDPAVFRPAPRRPTPGD